MSQNIATQPALDFDTTQNYTVEPQDLIVGDRVTRQSRTLNPSLTRSCQGCGRPFVPAGPQRYCSHGCYSDTLRKPIEQRFWAKVNRHGPPPSHQPSLGPCWLWTASSLNTFGHGQFTMRREDGRQLHVYAHRVAWELANGPIPAGLSVLHKCDVPACVRPDHLFLGTQADNLADAHRKGRLVDGLGARKLSDEAYRDILKPDTTRGYGIAMARKYGVSKVTISRIRHGRQGVTFHREARS